MSQLNSTLINIRDLFNSYWNTSSKWKKYLFRSTTIYSSFLILRYIFLNIQHKYILKLPPGPIGFFPILNSIPTIMFYGGQYFNQYAISQIYGPIASYSFFLGTLIQINDPKLVNQIYKGSNKQDTTEHHTSHPHPKGWHESNRNRNMFGHNYMVIKNIRKLISHESLSYKYLDDGISKAMDKLIFKSIDQYPQIPINVTNFIKPVHFSILLYTVTGLDFDSVDDPIWTTFFKAQDGATGELTQKSAPILLFGTQPPKSDGMIDYNDDTQIFSSLYRMCKWTEDFIDKNSKVILENKNAFFTRLLSENFNNNSYDEPKNKLYTKNELIFDIVSIFNAAIDTTNCTIHSLLINICRYQDIQQRMYDELAAIFKNGKYDAKVLQDELRKNENLNDFQAFIHEILRLFLPAFTMFPRVAKKDIKVGDYCIPKGYCFGINAIGVHYNENYWGDKSKNITSDQVYLNNFKDDNGRFKRSNNNLVTFGAGPRMCPGWQFALKELYILMAHFIWRYKMVFDPKDKNVKGKKLEDIEIKAKMTDNQFVIPNLNIKVLFIKRE